MGLDFDLSLSRVRSFKTKGWSIDETLGRTRDGAHNRVDGMPDCVFPSFGTYVHDTTDAYTM